MVGKRDKATIPGTLKTLVVDDEKLARDELFFLLGSFPDIEVIGTAGNGLEALESVKSETPDLIFMDVQMPGLDGLATARKIIQSGTHLPHLVFATAYDQYAVKAFELNAIDYLLKPVEKDRLAESIERVRNRFGLPQSIEHLDQILIQMKDNKQLAHVKLLIRNNSRMLLVDPEEIIYVAIKNGLINVVSTTVEGESNYKTIEELQAMIGSSDFWRPHRSYLVNINKIKEVVPWFRSTYQLRMDDKKKTQIPVSRGQTKRLRELFKL